MAFIVHSLPTTCVWQQQRASVSARLNVAVAGGGLGGLTLACYLVNSGMDVSVFERTRAYQSFGGPIQLQSNALALLADIDGELVEEVYRQGVKTGDRLAAIYDGPSARPLAHFDTARPALRNALPLTHVIERPKLQRLLLDFVESRAPGTVRNGAQVEGYVAREDGVQVKLNSGLTDKYDVLVGADGIWSQVRAQMHGAHKRSGAHYSGYVCYTATCKYECADVRGVAYKILLGAGRYFVVSDVGDGRLQWYAFVAAPAQSVRTLAGLRHEFNWNGDVARILQCTHEEDVEARAVYDRAPLMRSWSDKSVTLLGDAAHCMCPNLGQGGNMCVEDAYCLGAALQRESSVRDALAVYERKRRMRTAVVHGLARTSSDALRLYGTDNAYPGWGMFWHTIGPSVLSSTMPLLLDFLYVNLLEQEHAPAASR